MNYDRYSDRARKVLAEAQKDARRFRCEYVGTEHLALALLRENSSLGVIALKNTGISLVKLYASLQKTIEEHSTIGGGLVTDEPLAQTPALNKLLDFAEEEARTMKSGYVGCEHLMLGLTRSMESMGGAVLMCEGVNVSVVRKEIRDLMGLEFYNKYAPEDLAKAAIKMGWTVSTKLTVALRYVEQLKSTAYPQDFRSWLQEVCEEELELAETHEEMVTES